MRLGVIGLGRAFVLMLPAFRAHPRVPAARVLLVDDLLVTGWSLTLASVALHDAGAAAVVPLTLGVSG